MCKKIYVAMLMVTALALGIVFHSSRTLAHDLWATCGPCQPGQCLTMDLEYGHDLAKGAAADVSCVEPPVIIGPTGRIDSKLTEGARFVSVKPLAKGSYLVSAQRKLRWFTKTPEGTVDKPKNQVPEAVKCVRTIKFAKSVVNVGGALEDVSKPVGTELEVIPLANPGGLKAGDKLPVKVLLNGKPLVNFEVTASYKGFNGGHGSAAFSAQTDQQGVVKVEVSRAGLWLVKAFRLVPYPDQAVCDKFGQTAVLTFMVP